MKKNADSRPGNEYLDVCYLQHEMSLSQRKRTLGLLARAAVCGQKEMVEELIHSNASEGSLNASSLSKKPNVCADIQMGDSLSGSPLTQMLVYVLHHDCPDVIHGEILELLIGKNLDVNVFDFM